VVQFFSAGTIEEDMYMEQTSRVSLEEQATSFKALQGKSNFGSRQNAPNLLAKLRLVRCAEDLQEEEQQQHAGLELRQA
jgi:hypothetical protein